MNICVFIGSRPGKRACYLEQAEAVARLLHERGHSLVYGGASIGLMGRLADTMLREGGRVVGVIPEDLVAKEVGHASLSELHVVSSMHERKALMARLSDAFVAMPGGFGTLDELFEVLTWAQLGIHAKPIGILSTAGIFEPLRLLVDKLVEEGFVAEGHRGLFVMHTDAAQLLSALETFQPPPAVSKWQG